EPGGLVRGPQRDPAQRLRLLAGHRVHRLRRVAHRDRLQLPGARPAAGERGGGQRLRAAPGHLPDHHVRGAGREPAGRLRLRVPRPAYPAGGLNMTAGTSVAQGDLPSPALPGGTTARRARAVRLPRSPKILTGLGLLLGFAILAVVGPLLAPDNPSTSFHNSPVPLPPSVVHCPATTALQQDVFSQLLSGGR